MRTAGRRALILAAAALFTVAGCGQQRAPDPSRPAAAGPQATSRGSGFCTTGRLLPDAPAPGTQDPAAPSAEATASSPAGATASPPSEATPGPSSEPTATPSPKTTPAPSAGAPATPAPAATPPASPGAAAPSRYVYQRETSDLSKFEDSNADPKDYTAELGLPDGRRVVMFFCVGTGLFAQYYSAEARGWSKPQLIYRTSTNPCEAPRLFTRGGTVAASVDFGRFCYDGDPPDESVAAVSVGDPRRWQHHFTERFDGWVKVVIAPNGRRVTFFGDRAHGSRGSGRASLTWTRERGFSKPYFPRL